MRTCGPCDSDAALTARSVTMSPSRPLGCQDSATRPRPTIRGPLARLAAYLDRGARGPSGRLASQTTHPPPQTVRVTFRTRVRGVKLVHRYSARDPAVKREICPAMANISEPVARGVRHDPGRPGPVRRATAARAATVLRRDGRDRGRLPR